MKNIIYSLFVVLSFTTMSFAQEKSEIALSQGKQELFDSKESGVYEFTLVDQTSESITKSASYYTQYFTVAFDDNSGVATIAMVENDKKSRAVIMRFLTAAGARHVDVDGTIVSVNEFMVDYL